MPEGDLDRKQAVHGIWPVAGSTDLGETSCVLCDGALAPGEAWRVTLARSGNVLACTHCAMRSRREGDLSWLDGEDAAPGEAPMAHTDEIRRDLVEAYSHLYASSDVYEAGVADALDRITQELESPDEEG